MKYFDTSFEVIKIGENYQLPKIYSDKEIVRKGHFGFRWAGKGRSYLKFTYINQSKPYRLKVKDKLTLPEI